MQGPRKTPQNRQQTTSTSSSSKVKWLGLGSITWFKYGFSFLQNVFLAQNLGSFSVKIYNLDSRKKPKILSCSNASKWKVIHKRTWTGEDKKLEIINPSWVLAMSLSSSLHGVAHPSMQKKNYLFWIQTTRERIYGKTALSWGYWLRFFCILVYHNPQDSLKCSPQGIENRKRKTKGFPPLCSTCVLWHTQQKYKNFNR